MKNSKNEKLLILLFNGLIVIWLNLHLTDITKLFEIGMIFRFYATLLFVLSMNILFVVLLVLIIKDHRKIK